MTPEDVIGLPPIEKKAFFQVATRMRQRRAQLAREDPSIFCDFVLRDESTGGAIHQAPMHARWQEIISSYRHSCIWSHVEGGKTNQAIGRVLWEIGRNRNIRVCVVSKTTDMAKKIVRAIGQYITSDGEGNRRLREVFPNIKPTKDPALTWTAQSLTVERPAIMKDPTVAATGIEGNIHGSRIDLLIIDDVIDFDNTLTASKRETVINYIKNTLLGRLTANARVVVFGNAWHPEDAMHKLVKESGFNEFRFPVRTSQGELSWPERWSHQRIDDQRQMMGALEFSRALLCVAHDDTNAKFKREYINLALVAGQGRELHRTAASLYEDLSDEGLLRHANGRPISRAEVAAWDASWRLGSNVESLTLGGVYLYTGVDLAFSQRDSADLTCFFTLAILPDGRRRVVDIVAGRYSAPEIMSLVKDLYRRFHSTFIIENNSAQNFVVQTLQSQTPIPIKAFTTGKQKADKDQGILGLSVEFEAGKWIIPNKPDGTRDREVDEWVTELFRYDPSEHTGDRAMASWFAREGHRPIEMQSLRDGGGSVGVTVIEV